jgi:hypothetical protein
MRDRRPTLCWSSGLNLHGVHARQAPDTLLIELHRAAVVGRGLADRQQLVALALQRFSHRFGIEVSTVAHP